MHRFVLIFVVLCFPGLLFAEDLVRYSGSDASLQDRVEWVFQRANKENTFWMGYSVQRLMYPRETYLSGVSIHGDLFKGNKRTLQEWIYGVRTPEESDIKSAAKAELDRSDKKSTSKVWKEIGIFQQFKKGSNVPGRTMVMNLTISSRFDAPLYWIGQARHEESFQYLSNLYGRLNAKDKEDVMSALGIHPPGQAFPFFQKVLLSDEPEEAQEAAAIHVGEVDTPESLSLLKQVVEKSPYENVREAAVVGISEVKSEPAVQALYEIARSHRDRDLRETAISMIGDDPDARSVRFLEEIAWFDADSDIRETAIVMLAESDAGVPALLKIMDEHPSSETREIAVHMLAETVAGRKVLKDKLKQ